MSPNFQGCWDICPHVLATLAEHWINLYKIGLPFKWTLARDQRRSLLIAFSNEKKCLSEIQLYSIKYPLQLELRVVSS